MRFKQAEEWTEKMKKIKAKAHLRLQRQRRKKKLQILQSSKIKVPGKGLNGLRKNEELRIIEKKIVCPRLVLGYSANVVTREVEILNPNITTNPSTQVSLQSQEERFDRQRKNELWKKIK